MRLSSVVKSATQHGSYQLFGHFQPRPSILPNIFCHRFICLSLKVVAYLLLVTPKSCNFVIMEFPKSPPADRTHWWSYLRKQVPEILATCEWEQGTKSITLQGMDQRWSCVVQGQGQNWRAARLHAIDQAVAKFRQGKASAPADGENSANGFRVSL